MKNLFEITKREIGIIAKDHSILLTVIIAPLLYYFLLGYIYINKGESEINFGVIDQSNSQLSRLFIRYLDATQNLKVTEKFADYSEAVDAMNNFEIIGFVLIPPDFENNIQKGKSGTIALYLNTTRFLPSNDLFKAVSSVALTISAGIRVKYFMAKSYPPEGAMQKVLPLQPVIHNLFNPTNTYGDFLLPALFLLILHQTLLIGLGESITLENQKNSLIDLYKKSGNSVLGLIHRKSFYYILLYTLYAFTTYSVIFYLFNLRFAGSLFLLMLITFVFIMAVIYITFIIASFFKKQIVIMETLAFTSYPIFLISGFSWPLNSLPASLKFISNLLPITPFYSAFSRVVSMGANWQQVAPSVIQLSLLTLLYFAIAVIRIKYLVKKQSVSN